MLKWIRNKKEYIMAEEKKSNGFDVNKSSTAKYLNNLTDKEIFHRYFKKGKSTTNFGDELIEELNEWEDEKHLARKYPLIASLSGKCLDIIVSLLELKLPTALYPDGYVPNVPVITRDIEKVLGENVKALHEAVVASSNNKGTLYIYQLCDFFNELISNRSVGYALDNNASI